MKLNAIQRGSIFALTVCCLLVLTVGSVYGGDNKSVHASAVIYSCFDSTEIKGFANLRELQSEEGIKEVEVITKVFGMLEGKHAVHIHEKAACEPCGAAGGHFDPGPSGFSSPDGNHPYHSGDLVNIEVKKNGKGMSKTVSTRVTLSSGPLSLFDEDGSSLIIHVDPDTYCPEGDESGCAGGARAACGIIELDD